jgi:hypothetical protein
LIVEGSIRTGALDRDNADGSPVLRKFADRRVGAVKPVICAGVDLHFDFGTARCRAAPCTGDDAKRCRELLDRPVEPELRVQLFLGGGSQGVAEQVTGIAHKQTKKARRLGRTGLFAGDKEI